jgi:hypothetical protein
MRQKLLSATSKLPSGVYPVTLNVQLPRLDFTVGKAIDPCTEADRLRAKESGHRRSYRTQAPGIRESSRVEGMIQGAQEARQRETRELLTVLESWCGEVDVGERSQAHATISHVKSERRIEAPGISVLIDRSKTGGTVHVWVSAQKAVAAARRLEDLFQMTPFTGSRGKARQFFYWWTEGMPSDKAIESALR